MNIAVEPRDAAETAPPGDTIADRSPTSPQQSVSAQSPSPGDDKPPYPASAWPPTQEGPHGVRFDFNDGARIALPDAKSPWRVRLSDLDTGNILYDTTIAAGRDQSSSKRYYLRASASRSGRADASVLKHDYSAEGPRRPDPVPGRHARRHAGLVPLCGEVPGAAQVAGSTCAMSGKLIPLFRDAYPDIEFMTHEEVKPERYYATYQHRASSSTTRPTCSSPATSATSGCTGRRATSSASIPTEARADGSRSPTTAGRSPSPMSCIARAEPRRKRKYWNNPAAGSRSLRFLKDARLPRRLHRPEAGAWDGPRLERRSPTAPRTRPATGRFNERARWLKHADFFIGLSSGLAWLAWAVGAPVVMISGLHPSRPTSSRRPIG